MAVYPLSLGFRHEGLYPSYELENLLRLELPAKCSASVIFTQSPWQCYASNSPSFAALILASAKREIHGGRNY